MHSKAPLTLALAAASAAVLIAAPARAQSKPFPTSAHYAQGYEPSAATAAAAMSSYQSWKTHYLKNDCGNGYYRVDNGTGNASTFSEGQGYGMVLTAYFGDKAEFDGLWSFAKKNYNTKGLMGWHVTCSRFTTSDGGSGSATDGDTDIGFALLVASVQWGGSYAADATTYLATLKSVDFTTCATTGRTVPTAGSWQGNAACTTSGGGSNTSYWMPAYYRVFDTFTGDAFWGKAADDVVTLYGLAANATTGIIVNEVDQSGAPVSGQTYDYNSCRIPWRATLDYLWFGTPAVKTAMTKLTGWANTVGINKIVDGYNANGTPSGQYTGLNAFVGGFTVGAMTDTQALADSFATYFVGIADDNGGYYGASLRTLYLLTLSGNEWNPVLAGGDAGAGGTAAGDGGSAGDAAVVAADAAASGDAGSVSAGLSGGSGDGGSGGVQAGNAAGDKAAGGCGCGVVGKSQPLRAGGPLVLLTLVPLLRLRLASRRAALRKRSKRP
jgi:endo-1,4-beta-D-glucanase Y